MPPPSETEVRLLHLVQKLQFVLAGHCLTKALSIIIVCHLKSTHTHKNGNSKVYLGKLFSDVVALQDAGQDLTCSPNHTSQSHFPKLLCSLNQPGMKSYQGEEQQLEKSQSIKKNPISWFHFEESLQPHPPTSKLR